MELIRSKKQKVWGWPGVVNFTLGGMASGFYLLSSLLMVLQDGMLGLSQPAGFKLVAPALIGLGFLALTTEAGHPLRARYLFRSSSRLQPSIGSFHTRLSGAWLLRRPWD